ncbi:MAG: hypothetical protein IH843_05105 [Thaumarchaeota archaeon]|nr:hypothetical protein [Nitrososphaerota archaeon]
MNYEQCFSVYENSDVMRLLDLLLMNTMNCYIELNIKLYTHIGFQPSLMHLIWTEGELMKSIKSVTGFEIMSKEKIDQLRKKS